MTDSSGLPTKESPDTETKLEIGILLNAVERLQTALAKRILAEWNEQNVREGVLNNWPVQQSWDDLVGSSHAIFWQAARKEAGIEHTPAFREFLDRLYYKYELESPDV